MVIIDIVLMSMELSQGKLQQQVSMSVMKKAMDQVEGNADFIEKMIGDSNLKALQNVIQPYYGRNIDLKGKK